MSEYSTLVKQAMLEARRYIEGLSDKERKDREFGDVVLEAKKLEEALGHIEITHRTIAEWEIVLKRAEIAVRKATVWCQDKGNDASWVILKETAQELEGMLDVLVLELERRFGI